MSTPRLKVWVAQPFADDIVQKLEVNFDVITTDVVTKHTSAQIADILSQVHGAVVSLNEKIGAAEIANAPQLQVIANVGVGYNNLDIDALSAAGILATNTPDVLTETTADMAFTLLLAAARRVSESEQWLRQGHWGEWSFNSMLGQDIHSSTLGIIGMGRIGQAIARRARAFNMQVLYHNRSPLPADIETAFFARYVDFSTLLKQSDHVMLVLPYSTQTHHLIDAAALAQMKPTATLVNIARGGIVDEQALAQALANGRLAAAGLDVFEGEPNVCPELLALRNIVLTPHIGSATVVTRRAMLTLAVDNLQAALGIGEHAGCPATTINMNKWARKGIIAI